MAYTADFALTALEAEPATVTINVKGLEGTEDYATVSIRQEHEECGVIEVASVSVVNTMPDDDSLYSNPISLPAGAYQFIITAEGQDTIDAESTLQAGLEYTIYVQFEQNP